LRLHPLGGYNGAEGKGLEKNADHLKEKKERNREKKKRRSGQKTRIKQVVITARQATNPYPETDGLFPIEKG